MAIDEFLVLSLAQPRQHLWPARQWEREDDVLLMQHRCLGQWAAPQHLWPARQWEREDDVHDLVCGA